MKILDWLGITTPTKKFTVKCKLGDDRKWRVVTPFFPGKGPWNYGEGPKPGDEIEVPLDLVQADEPYCHSFEEKAANSDETNPAKPSSHNDRNLWVAARIIKT
jgi:hypothetical protein